MKRKHMRIATLLLTLSLLAGLLAGCGSTGTSASEPVASASSVAAPEISEAPAAEEPVPEQPSVVEEASVAEPVEEIQIPEVQYPLVDEPQTLTLWTSFPPPMANALNGDVSQMYAYQVAAEVTGISLDITVVTNDAASEQFSLNSAANDWTDLIYAVSTYTASLEAAVDDEIIIALNDYLEEYAPNYTAVLNENPDFKKQVTLDSGLMAAICGMEDLSTIVSGPQIRKDLLDEVGMEIPGTIAELEEVLLAFKNELGIKYPIYSSALNSWVYSAVITSAYGASNFFIDENGTVVCGWVDPAYEDMITLMNDWHNKGIITDDYLTLTGVESAIQGGLTAVWCDNIKTMTPTAEAATSVATCDIVAMPYVTVEEGGSAYVNTTNLASDPFSVSLCCEYPELAVGLLNFFFTEEGMMACNYGIENDSYVYDENSNPIFTDLVMNNPDGLDMTVAKAIYSSFAMPFVHMPSRTTVTYVDEDEFAASDIWSQNVDNSRTYRGDMTIDESSTYSAVMADIETYVGEMVPKYIVGELPMDQWEDFTATLIEMGIEDAVAMKQAAYDRYLQR